MLVHLADAKFERLNARVILERMNMLVLYLIGVEDFTCIKEVMPFISPGHASVLTTYLGPGRRTCPRPKEAAKWYTNGRQGLLT